MNPCGAAPRPFAPAGAPAGTAAGKAHAGGHERPRARTRRRLSSEREPGFAPAGAPTGTAAKLARRWAVLRRAGIDRVTRRRGARERSSAPVIRQTLASKGHASWSLRGRPAMPPSRLRRGGG
jgi:hypothetical protein